PDEYAYDFRVIWPDGTMHWLWVKGRVVQRFDTGRGRVVQGVLIDITDRKMLERRMERLSLLYATLSECNQAIVYSRNEGELFERISSAPVRMGLAAMTWIGMTNRSTGLVEPVAGEGVGADEYLRVRTGMVRQSSANSEDLVATAISQDRLVMHNIEFDGSGLNDAATRLGWHSVAVLPIRRRNVAVGAMSMYSTDPDFFDESLNDLLVEMMGDISFALDAFDEERLRKEAENELRAAEARFRGIVEQSVAGIYILQDGNFVYCNSRAASILGFDNAEALIGTEVAVLSGFAEAAEGNGLERLGDSAHESVFEVRQANGQLAHLWVTSASAEYRGRLAQIGLIEDVTALRNYETTLEEHLRAVEVLLQATVGVATSLSEQRDPYTAGHQHRVGEISVAIGEEMGLDPDRLEGLRIAGQLHDVGKMAIPSEILTRPGQLNDMERAIIQQHPQSGYDVLKGVPFPWPVALVALQHHERIDGSGYPSGLRGSEIILEAQIVAVADVVEAMSSHRPYRPGLGVEAALAEIERRAGTSFDATVVAACVRRVRDLGFQLL
ncbi:MAG: PAS domain S-box protein, partial [Acidimicrobiaceae bacterium]|nr:PAS domain S-box protein [Acidimicrobiaceae bacterium]